MFVKVAEYNSNSILMHRGGLVLTTKKEDAGEATLLNPIYLPFFLWKLS